MPFESTEAVALPAPVSHPSPVPAAAAPTVDDKSVAFIKSPMVGTFYRAPSPDSAPFASVKQPCAQKASFALLRP